MKDFINVDPSINTNRCSAMMVRVDTYPEFCVGEVVARPVMVAYPCAGLIPVLAKLAVFHLLEVAHFGGCCVHEV